VQSLVRGIHRFRREYFASHRALFERLARDGQNPDTLFLTCSDSRVVPNLITSAAPGDMFIVRNVGNVVPADAADRWGGTAASIEYAVQILGVKQIILCGHTQCGAMRAILEPALLEKVPRVRRWLLPTQGELLSILRERYPHLTGEALQAAAVEENVLIQLERLRAFPFIAEALQEGTLRMNGWVFKISTGQVFDYDPEKEEFALLGAR
jgi:carbonic anhydrase